MATKKEREKEIETNKFIRWKKAEKAYIKGDKVSGQGSKTKKKKRMKERV